MHEYYQFSDHILPVEGGLINRLEKILMDQTIYLTVKCSMYIMAVGLLQGESFGDVKENVKDRIGGIVLTAWKFWPLVHCVTYGFIPARHRILWVNCVDLIWNAILASMSNKGDKQEVPSGEGVSVDEGLPASVGDHILLAKEILTSNAKEMDQTTLLPVTGEEILSTETPSSTASPLSNSTVAMLP